MPRSTFTICSFWWAEALALSGELARAIEVFERLLGYANEHGLYSEDIDPASGEMLGNFPAGVHARWIDQRRDHDRPAESCTRKDCAVAVLRGLRFRAVRLLCDQRNRVFRWCNGSVPLST